MRLVLDIEPLGDRDCYHCGKQNLVTHPDKAKVAADLSYVTIAGHCPDCGYTFNFRYQMVLSNILERLECLC